MDSATRFKWCYPLHSLKQDLLPALQQFCRHIGRRPRQILTDFDHKLCGQRVLDYFTDPNPSVSCTIKSVSSDHQNRNGLSERNRRSVLRMSCGWLASALLPTKFWWFALKRATKISNYIPIKLDNKLTTPFQLVYGMKPDLYNLFPLFSVAYISKHKDGTKARLNLHSKSIRAIG